jgi:hypothetical protein
MKSCRDLEQLEIFNHQGMIAFPANWEDKIELNRQQRSAVRSPTSSQHVISGQQFFSNDT